ncbi:MAG: hypothetical protein KF894_00475 [Labilithrix sp.]|nr:hypothetical protein [Labilithrix sp.]
MSKDGSSTDDDDDDRDDDERDNDDDDDRDNDDDDDDDDDDRDDAHGLAQAQVDPALDVRATEDVLGVHLVVRPAATPEAFGRVDAAERLRMQLGRARGARELDVTFDQVARIGERVGTPWRALEWTAEDRQSGKVLRYVRSESAWRTIVSTGGSMSKDGSSTADTSDVMALRTSGSRKPMDRSADAARSNDDDLTDLRWRKRIRRST